MELKNVRKVTFKLREDVSPEIGTLIPGKYDKRYYSFSDAREIEKCIVSFLKRNFALEEDIKFDLVLYGKVNEALLTILACDIVKWGRVAGLVYIKPGDDPVRLFPRNDGFVWNI